MHGNSLHAYTDSMQTHAIESYLVCLAMHAAQLERHILENNPRSSEFAACCEADVAAAVLLTPCTELCTGSAERTCSCNCPSQPTHQNRPCSSPQTLASRTRNANQKPCAIPQACCLEMHVLQAALEQARQLLIPQPLLIPRRHCDPVTSMPTMLHKSLPSSG